MEIVLQVLSIRDLVIFSVSDERILPIPNQVRTLHGSIVDFSLLGIKPDFVKVLEQILVCVLPLHSWIPFLFHHLESRLF